MSTQLEPKAPYVAWGRFEGFLRTLKEKGVPTRIDRSLMSSRSGTEQSQIRGALRFFGLVHGDSDEATAELRSVVAAIDSDTWPSQAQRLVDAYESITAGVDLQNGTSAELYDGFRANGGVGGSLAEKAVRLYLTVRDQAGLESSKHFPPRVSASSGSRTSARSIRRVKRARPESPPASEAAAVTASGVERLTCSVPGGKTVTILLPEDLAGGEIDFVLTYMTGIMELLRRRAEPDNGKSERPLAALGREESQ